MAASASSGSITSPDPEIRNVCPWSATTSRASRLRSILSVRQSLASSTAERFRLPAYCSSLVSKRANSEKASAVEPANLLGGVLEHVVAQGDLAVRGHDRMAVAAHADHRRGANAWTLCRDGSLIRDQENPPGLRRPAGRKSFKTQ